ncbi:hypothetical protein [Paraflavitalea pollutisoli]|uniref:hypothetical protein n=1 Tax=Paraflavitalea pollutisoli TaxID=3034143 RepID=UPI0023ED0A29|nr:hypothetical protein [Paraflavitalea sp. H1-2-19X]
MLSPKEKRFVKYWEEQRTGGRVSYFALYIPVITLITAIVCSFLFSMISMIGLSYFVSVGILSLVFGIAITVYTWLHNERRFKGIIKREIREGEQQIR